MAHTNPIHPLKFQGGDTDLVTGDPVLWTWSGFCLAGPLYLYLKKNENIQIQFIEIMIQAIFKGLMFFGFYVALLKSNQRI